MTMEPIKPDNLPPMPADAPPQSSGDASGDAGGEAVREQRPRSIFGRVGRHLRHVGQSVASVAIGRWLNDAAGASAEEAEATEVKPAELRPQRRLNVLHNVTETLRGAADAYIAAKLDEIEARVDVKLNEIERRIDEKLLDLHHQLADMRDKELRHRLRLLKITLVFSALVAVLSLGYKLIVHYLT